MADLDFRVPTPHPIYAVHPELEVELVAWLQGSPSTPRDQLSPGLRRHLERFNDLADSTGRLPGKATAQIEAEKYDLRGCDFSGIRLFLTPPSGSRPDLSGACLDGATFGGAQLRSINLHGAHLRSAHFAGCELPEADLGDAHLEGAAFVGGSLAGATLDGATLSSPVGTGAASFSGVNLEGTNFRGVTGRGVTFREITSYQGTDFTGADLRDATFHAEVMSGAILEHSVLWRADLTAADLGGVRVAGAEFRQVRSGKSPIQQHKPRWPFRTRSWFSCFRVSSAADLADARRVPLVVDSRRAHWPGPLNVRRTHNSQVPSMFETRWFTVTARLGIIVSLILGVLSLVD
jgi:uncharacterized protein YjbI with pentapeptide repeats